MVQTGMVLGGRYEILEHIGSGGMADVFKAICHRTNRYVAVKVLRSEYCEDEVLVRRFASEARSTSGLQHPNVVSILDEGVDKGVHYIVMELVEGMTLKRYIRRYGRLSVRETVDFGIQIASGIQAAHKHDIVHRDIKPQNIIVSDSGSLKVTDFGIAKAATGDTIASSTMGSVRYLSPEQARGGYSDARTDIYSLGITLYEMATGKVPFDGENTVAIALMHLKDEIVPPRNYFPDIPISLENIIMKCTKKRPEERYQTAGELIQDLQRVFTSPDGNYVYTKPQVDDSPTIPRSKDEIEAIKKSLIETAETKKETVQTQEQPDEDYEDDRAIHPKMEKLILVITIIFGIFMACLVFYVLGTTTNLLHFSRATTEDNLSEEKQTTEDTGMTTEDIRYVPLPSFLNMTKKEAKQTAEALSLKAEFEYEDDVNKNDMDLIVVAQQYEEGEALPENESILLTLGLSKKDRNKRIEVPALVNYKEKEAVKKLEKLGLKAKVVYSNSDSVKEGYVIRQTPKGGSVVDKGFSITITVSRGVSQVRVPSLYGLNQETAERELNRVGLKLGDVSSDYSGSVGVGDVIDQGIASGKLVDKGTKVSIVISLGEKETYHYEGSVSIYDSPFEEAEYGSVELKLIQGKTKKTIYSNQNASGETFPIEVTFDSRSDKSAEVIFLVNGEEYNSYPVEWNAVAD